MKQYGIRTGDYIYTGESVRDEQHLETLAGARRMVKRMIKADKAAGVESLALPGIIMAVAGWLTGGAM